MKEYPISCWCGVHPGFVSRDRFAEMKECGINLIPVAYDTETNLTVLKWCEELGLRAIVHDAPLDRALSQADGWEDGLRKMADTYRDCPALLWYHLKDEPLDEEFPLLGKIASAMREIDPEHPVYINLLPCISFQLMWNIPLEESIRRYKEHVRKYLDTVRPAMLSWDQYSFRKREVETLGELPEAAVSPECRTTDHLEGKLYEEWDHPGFFDNLEINRSMSREYGIFFMNIILVTEHWFYRHLGEAELRWEAFNSFAYGVDILSYFTYWTPGVTGEPWSYHHGIINADGTRDAHYDMVRKINRELNVLYGVTADKTSTAVFHVGEEADDVTPFAPYAGIADIGAATLTVGFFDEDAMVLVNKDHHAPQTVTVTTHKKLCILDKETGAERPLAAENGVYTLTLAAGDGELILIS